jgi:hypothetical protein
MKRLLFFATFAALSCSRINADKGARYVCSRDAAEPERECPGTWVCGLEGFCLNPAVAGPNRCLAQQDCFQGWHCGIEGTCYDLATATDVACAGDDDCSSSWRCGQNGTCHARDVGAALACSADSDCEANWRCGPDGTCLDSKTDSLRPTEDAGTPMGTLVSPLALQGGAELVAISDEDSTGSVVQCDGGINNYVSTSFSFVADGGLTKLVRYSGFLQGLPQFDANCQRLPSLPLRVASIPGAARGVKELAEHGDRTYALYADGGIVRFGWLDGGLTSEWISTPAPIQHIKLGSERDDTLLASNPSMAAMLQPNSSWLVAPPLPVLMNGQPAIKDLTFIGERGRGYLVAATTGGLMAIELVLNVFAPVGWLPYPLTPSECLGAIKRPYGLEKVNYLMVNGSNAPMPVLSVVRSFPDTMPPSEELVLMTANVAGGATCPMLPVYQGSASFFAVTAHYGDQCPAGFRGHALGGFGDGGVDVFAQCALLDGGVRTELERLVPGSTTIGGINDDPDHDLELLRATTTFSTTNPRRAALRGAHGELWFTGSAGVVPLQALGLTDVPMLVVGDLNRPFAMQAPIVLNSLKSTATELTDYNVSEYSSAAGFTYATHESALVAGVQGQPNWLLARYRAGNQVITLVADNYGLGAPSESKPLAMIAQTAFELSSFTLAASAPSSDGGTSLLVSTGDALLAADVSHVPDGGYPFNPAGFAAMPELKVVASIVPRATITSLWALPADPQPSHAARYAEGYLVTAGRVFRYHADNPVVWHSEELLVTPAEAVEVWGDGRRARAGYRDGTVYSLPSRVTVAPALLAGASTVVDYAQACGHSFALASDGLYHLVANASESVGQWRRVVLATDERQPDYTKGKLHSDGTGLLVFLPFGVVERVGGFGCLP